MMGPCPLIYGGKLGLPAPFCELLAVWAALGVERLDVKAAMLCETPSANMNCSRSSMLVRPLAAPLNATKYTEWHIHTYIYIQARIYIYTHIYTQHAFDCCCIFVHITTITTKFCYRMVFVTVFCDFVCLILLVVFFWYFFFSRRRVHVWRGQAGGRAAQADFCDTHVCGLYVYFYRYRYRFRFNK